MKKFIGYFLIFSLIALAGCSKELTEEERKAEIRKQLEEEKSVTEMKEKEQSAHDPKDLAVGDEVQKQLEEEKSVTEEKEKEQNFYDPKDLTVGDEVGGLKITDVFYDEGERFILKLEGSISMKGIITGEYDEMFGSNIFYFQPKEETFDRPIKYTFHSGFSENINAFEGECDISSFLDDNTEAFLLEGNGLAVDVVITGFHLAQQDETSGGQQVIIEKCNILSKNNEPKESENKKQPIVRETENDYTKGYSLEAKNNALYVTYDNTNNTRELFQLGKEYSINNGFAATFFYITLYEIKNIQYSPYQEMFYFMDNGILYSYNFENEKISTYFFGKNILSDYRIIDAGEYTGYYAIKNNKNEAKLFDVDGDFVMNIESLNGEIIKKEEKTKEKEPIKSDYTYLNFSTETINNVEVKYNEALAVLIPKYSGRHIKTLEKDTRHIFIGGIEGVSSSGVTSGFYNSKNIVHNDNICLGGFGKIQVMTFTYYDDKVGHREDKVVENLENSLIRIHTNLNYAEIRLEVFFVVELPNGEVYSDTLIFDQNWENDTYHPIIIKP